MSYELRLAAKICRRYSDILHHCLSALDSEPENTWLSAITGSCHCFACWNSGASCCWVKHICTSGAHSLQLAAQKLYASWRHDNRPISSVFTVDWPATWNSIYSRQTCDIGHDIILFCCCMMFVRRTIFYWFELSLWCSVYFFADQYCLDIACFRLTTTVLEKNINKTTSWDTDTHTVNSVEILT